MIKDGKYVQIVEIKVGEGKELMIELWGQDQRLKRVSINKQIAKVNSDSHITGLPQLSPDGSFCIFAAEIKTEKKSFYDLLSKKDENEKKEEKDDSKIGKG